jgi:hypothetical protein
MWIKNNPYYQNFDIGAQMTALGVIRLSLHDRFEGYTYMGRSNVPTL